MPALTLDQLQEMGVLRLPVTNFMPPEGEPFEFHAYVVIPAQGAQAVVVQFRVPEGRNGVVKRLGNVFIGGGFQEGQGLITWQLYLDGDGIGVANGGVVAPNFDNIVASLGSVAAPSAIDGIRIKESQLVTLLVRNAAAGVVPAGQLIGGRLGGYFYPIDLEPKALSF